MADHTQSWAERTVEVPPGMIPPDALATPAAPSAVPGPAPAIPFQRGVAQVGRGEPGRETFAAPHEPIGTGWPHEHADGGWPDQHAGRPRLPLSHHLAQLRRGGEWSALGALFSFVCWGIWAISSRGDLTSPMVTFVLTLLVAVGLFTLSRLVGRLVLERQLGRVRRGARAAHVVAGLFLIGVGFAYLRQTEWVVSAWNWITGFW